MSQATTSRPGSARLATRRRKTSAVEAALGPAFEALSATGRARARAVRARGQEDARLEVARARAEAARIVAEARAQGADAAARIAAGQLVAARRSAREKVLAARTRAYEALRDEAIAALTRRARSAPGQALARRLSAAVRERLGAGASVRATAPDTLDVEAEVRNRRCAIGPASLVDWVLASAAREIGRLWR